MAEKVKSEGFSRFSIAPQVHSDLTTHELLTGWVVAPTSDAALTNSVTREELADRIMNDPETRKQSREVLDKITDKNVVPLFRIIIDRGGKGVRKEGLVSTSLTPEMLFKNAKFFTTGRMTSDDKASLIRYDVPKDKIIAFLPALTKGISNKSNEKLITKGFGQQAISGFNKVRNPTAYAKRLLKDQQETLADVTGLDGLFLEDIPGILFNPFGSEDSFLIPDQGFVYRPSVIMQGLVNTPEEYAAAQRGGKTLDPFDLRVGEPKGSPQNSFRLGKRLQTSRS
jgi:hypothetical protein